VEDDVSVLNVASRCAGAEHELAERLHASALQCTLRFSQEMPVESMRGNCTGLKTIDWATSGSTIRHDEYALSFHECR
jgi:hypothetical protein